MKTFQDLLPSIKNASLPLPKLPPPFCTQLLKLKMSHYSSALPSPPKKLNKTFPQSLHVPQKYSYKPTLTSTMLSMQSPLGSLLPYTATPWLLATSLTNPEPKNSSCEARLQLT